MPGTGEEISLEELSRSDVESVLTWRYPSEYALYDLAETDRATFLDPTNEYLVIRRAGELIGYVCLGVEARVAGMTADATLVDLGVGMRPDLTGGGQSKQVMPAVLTALQQRLGAVTFRAVIKDWNTRAQRAAEHAGFRSSGRHENDGGAWVLLTREPS